MSRYRKVPVTLWTMPAVRTLTRPRPNATSLLLYLWTGPHTTAAPGLFTAGEAQLAESLRWPLAGFRRAFAELERHALARAEWSARVLWVPAMVAAHAPESPNVVKSWRRAVDEVADCELKDVAVRELLGFLKGLEKSEAFREAFGYDFD